MKSVVRVDVDLSLPVRSRVAGVLSLPPFRIILSQVGTLVASGIMKTVAPAMVNALLKDYNSRKHNFDC